MEVKETAACGISLREFAIEFETDEIVDIYRIINFAHTGDGFYDEDFLEDLKSQISYIVGPSVEQEPSEEVEEETIHWEDTGSSYVLHFNEPEGARLFQCFDAVEHPEGGFDRAMSKKLLDQMMEMASNILENITVINR